MSLVLAEKDAAVMLAEALAIYKTETGDTLAPADPRRLHLQALLALLVQARALIDFSGKQSLLRYVTATYIEELAALWGEDPLPAVGSECTVRFSTTGAATIPAGTRVTDGINQWAATAEGVVLPLEFFVDLLCRATVAGSASNGVAIGQIDTLVDSVPGVASVSNTTETSSGRDIETTEAFRERLRLVPESRSTAGPRSAYEALTLAASSAVADVEALGPDDAAEMAGVAPTPGEVHVLIIEGARDAAGQVISVIPEPSVALIAAIDGYLTGEEVRPLGDNVIVKAPIFVDFDIGAEYWIATSRSGEVAAIQAAVEDAVEAYKLWQVKIGRDVNASEFIARLVNAGAKRVAISLGPVYAQLERDECARVDYEQVTYEGLEDD